MTRNDKKLCLSHSKSQEAYIIWSWILVHKNKMMTFPDTFFFFFLILISRVVREVKVQKMAQNDKKFLCVSLCISETIPHLILVFWYACVKWWCLKQFFSFFQNSDILDFALWFRKGKVSDRGGHSGGVETIL